MPFILKFIHWDWFRAGIAPLTIGVFFLGGVELFFIGLVGEYILSINSRVLDRPLVVEEERLNFETPENPDPRRKGPAGVPGTAEMDQRLSRGQGGKWAS